MVAVVEYSVRSAEPNTDDSSRRQSIDRAVDHRDVGAQADGHFRRVGTRDATAENHHFRRRHARHAAEQYAEAAVGLLQAGRSHLDRHTAGYLAHGREQRQRTVGRRDRLVSDGGRAGFHQAPGLHRIGGQVQVGEQHLALAQHLALDRLRLLDLDHHLGALEDFAGARGNHRPGGPELGVVDADAVAGAALDEDFVSGGHQLAHSRRHHAYAVFVNLDFPRNADAHSCLPVSPTDRLGFSAW